MRPFFSKTVPLGRRLAALALLASGCLKGPQYQRPVAAVPQSYKEAPPEGWKEAQPNDGVLRGKWWEIFGDPAPERARGAGQHLQPERVAGRGAVPRSQAAVRVARSALFPTVSASPSATGSQASSRLSTSGSRSPAGTYDTSGQRFLHR